MAGLSRTLRWALLISILAHIGFLLLGRGFHFGWQDAEDKEVIEARLVAPPPPPVKPVKQNKPAAPPPAPTVPTPVMARSETPVPAPAVSSPAPPRVVPPEAAATLPARALPASGRIRYAVSKGDQSFVVGRAVHEWQVEGDRYTLRSTIETTGLVSLFANVKLSQSSRGWTYANGLKPLEFRDERKGGRYRADFDWERGSVLLGTDQSVSVSAGAQDLLSMFYQFALYPLDTPEVSVTVATGRRVENYVFKVDPDARVHMRDNDVLAYHLRYQGSDGGVEVWLARDMDRLPVKIRYVDRNGGVTELLADEISFQEKK